MSIGASFDVLLCLLLLATAIGAVGGRRLFAGVGLFIAYGLLLSIGWVRLGAVDVALAEAAIGAGLTGVLLLAAVARLRAASPPPPAPPRSRLLPLLASAALSGVLMWAVAGLVDRGAGLATQVAANLQRSGAENPVTAVLLNFRGYDTLLETVVLMIALIATWSLAPQGMWGGRPGLRQQVRPDGVLATFGRLLPPFGLLVGVHLVWIGASAPGGAFQGATVLAAVWLLTLMAGALQPPATAQRWPRWAMVAGPLVFLAAGVCGFSQGAFLAYAPELAKATMLVVEAALAVSIAAILALLLLGPPRQAP